MFAGYSPRRSFNKPFHRRKIGLIFIIPQIEVRLAGHVCRKSFAEPLKSYFAERSPLRVSFHTSKLSILDRHQDNVRARACSLGLVAYFVLKPARPTRCFVNLQLSHSSCLTHLSILRRLCDIHYAQAWLSRVMRRAYITMPNLIYIAPKNP